MNDKDEPEVVLCVRAKDGPRVLGAYTRVCNEAAFWHSLGYSTFVGVISDEHLLVLKDIPREPRG